MRPLKWVRQPVLEQLQGRCLWKVDTIGTVTNNFSSSICAGGVVGEDLCYGGDPGGPLVCLDQNKAFYAAGIALDGTLQCAIGVGLQYTKIQNYLQWIRYAALTKRDCIGDLFMPPHTVAESTHRCPQHESGKSSEGR